MATPIPKNRAEVELDRILEATGGELVLGGRARPRHASGVSTDTRALDNGSAFVAVAGGHAHLRAAAAAGAAFAVVERRWLSETGGARSSPLPLVAVESTVGALCEIARAHARAWRSLGGARRLVAITGSAGKTTTRVATEAILSSVAPGAVHATTGNLNNRVGAPMVLLGLEPRHRIGVLELGTNEPGEIATLAATVEPDVAVVTLIAAAHVEGLGSMDGVAAEKGALLRGLGPDAWAIGCSDDARVAALVADAPAGHRVTYGFGPNADMRIVERDLRLPAHPNALFESTVTIQTRGNGRIELSSPLLGEAGALACAAAVSVASALGLRLDGAAASAALGRADVGGGAGRLVPRVLGDGTWLVDDSYNANPASAKASIRAAAEIARAAGRRLVLVLGEMRELGAETERGHAEVGEQAAASGAAAVVAVAGAASGIAAAAEHNGAKAVFESSTDAAAATVLGLLRPGDVVLVKGSRGVATERIASAIAARHGGSPNRGKEERA